MRSPIVTGRGTYTGTIAVPRNQPRDESGAFILSPEQQAGSHQAALLGAAQRAQRAGLPASSVPILANLFEGRGFFPDLSALESGTGFGGVYVDPATINVTAGGGGPGGGPAGAGVAPGGAPGGAAFGLSTNMLLAIGAAIVAIVLLRKKR